MIELFTLGLIDEDDIADLFGDSKKGKKKKKVTVAQTAVPTSPEPEIEEDDFYKSRKKRKMEL